MKKELLEKINAKKAELRAMLETVQLEKRGFTGEEDTSFTQKEGELKALNAELRSLDTLDGYKEETRSVELTDEEVELRQLDGYMRNKKHEDLTETEYRALSVTTDNKAIIPENVAGIVVEKMEETSSLFAKARKFPSVNGTLKIAKENEHSDAGFVGEGVNVVELGIKLGEVKLTQKRVGASISISQQLLNDAGFDVAGYAVEKLSKRTAKAVEKSALVGVGGDDAFAGVTKDTDVEKVTGTVIDIDFLMDMYNTLHPNFLGQAQWIMTRDMYKKVAKLKDGNGHFYVQNAIVNGRPTLTLFGCVIEISDALTVGSPIVLIDIQSAYAILIKKGFELKQVSADTTQALRGSHLFVLDAYMDGAVYNPQAVVISEITGG